MSVTNRSSAPRSWMRGALALALSACGSAADRIEAPPGDPIAETLEGLGVDTTATARLDDRGDALPDGYSPLGASRDFAASRELLVLGMPLHPSSGFDSHLTLVEQVPDGLDGSGRQIYDTEVLFAPAAAGTPWADARADGSLRAAARADLDRDGLEELAVVYWDAGAGALQLQRYDDQGAGFAATAAVPIELSGAAPRAIAVESGDLDGDGRAELVIALSFETGARLVFVRNVDGTLVPDAAGVPLPQTLAGSEVSVALATGNLDHDPAHEVIAVVNEYREQANAPAIGVARYHVLDSADRAFAVVASGLVRATSGALNRTALTADVAMGDIDGDHLDEPIFGGLTHFDPDGDCDYRYLLVALDDLAHGLAPLGAREQDAGLGGQCRAGAPLRLRHVHVNTLDLDGDGHPEIQANQFVYEDFVGAPPFTRVAGVEIEPRSLFAYDGGYTGRFDRHTSAMVTGDLTADGRGDVALYSQATHKLEIWGIGEPARTWTRQGTIALAPLAGDAAVAPVLLAPNVNHDSLVLKYDGGEHRLVFTEPIVIAALAAAPCHGNLSQDRSYCRTALGVAESSSVETEDTYTITTSSSVGFSTEFSILGAKVAGLDVLATVQAHASRVTSKAYTLTKRLVYTTGPIEDTVIFTTIPHDQYTYTVLSHRDPELIGAKIVISLPRSPIELQVSRDYYNAHIRDGLKIDEAIFRHAAGDPRSYPTASEKDRLLARHGGFAVGPQAVGQGGGLQTLEINVHEVSGGGVSWGAEFNLDVKATAGALVTGFSVGAGEERSLRINHGKESSYVGSVTNLSEAELAKHGYQFGLFTYVYEEPDSGRQLEVVHYWVE